MIHLCSIWQKLLVNDQQKTNAVDLDVLSAFNHEQHRDFAARLRSLDIKEELIYVVLDFLYKKVHSVLSVSLHLKVVLIGPCCGAYI